MIIHRDYKICVTGGGEFLIKFKGDFIDGDSIPSPVKKDAMPVFSVDTLKDATEIRTMFCKRGSDADGRVTYITNPNIRNFSLEELGIHFNHYYHRTKGKKK